MIDIISLEPLEPLFLSHSGLVPVTLPVLHRLHSDRHENQLHPLAGPEDPRPGNYWGRSSEVPQCHGIPSVGHVSFFSRRFTQFFRPSAKEGYFITSLFVLLAQAYFWIPKKDCWRNHRIRANSPCKGKETHQGFAEAECHGDRAVSPRLCKSCCNDVHFQQLFRLTKMSSVNTSSCIKSSDGDPKRPPKLLAPVVSSTSKGAKKARITGIPGCLPSVTVSAAINLSRFCKGPFPLAASTLWGCAKVQRVELFLRWRI